MTFQVRKKGYNIHSVVRQAGYRPLRYTEQNELNCVRPLGGEYPRFHLYVTEREDAIIFNLHLDQKKPVYEGAPAHGGEYEGDIVEQEADRIRAAIA